MRPTAYPSNSLLKMKILTGMSGPFDLLSLVGYSAGKASARPIELLIDYLRFQREAMKALSYSVTEFWAARMASSSGMR